ncbi:MAG: hypothetical protein BWY06_02314 [Candidatus Latescibacteria bacterium ADurb.Bin168]|nr:MAG: hypothetical protein BWY06_02314 [Candidatus Latescibacteria bacterium ADurb.Bin168]
MGHLDVCRGARPRGRHAAHPRGGKPHHPARRSGENAALRGAVSIPVFPAALRQAQGPARAARRGPSTGSGTARADGEALNHGSRSSRYVARVSATPAFATRRPGGAGLRVTWNLVNVSCSPSSQRCIGEPRVRSGYAIHAGVAGHLDTRRRSRGRTSPHSMTGQNPLRRDEPPAVSE